MMVTVIICGMFARPSQAEILNSRPQTPATIASCLLNIGVECQAPVINPKLPTSSVSAAPNPAGGTTNLVTITGTVTGDSLTSYVLMLNDSVVQQASNLTTKSVTVSADWNVLTPNKVPSGIYIITLDATDRDGVVSRASKKVTVDNDGPSVSVTGGNTIIKSGSVSPTVTATDPSGIASYVWTADPANPAVLSFVDTSSQPSFTPTVEGTYAFTVVVTDSLGNPTTNTFSFSHVRDLATIPLPTTQNPTDALIDQTPATPTIQAATTHPMGQSGPDQKTTPTDAGVLGTTTTNSEPTEPTKTIASIAPTTSGWSIFGILWYWWLVVAGIIFTAWLVIKKMILSRASEDS